LDIAASLSKWGQREELADFGAEFLGNLERQRQGGVVLASFEIADGLLMNPHSISELLARKTFFDA